MKRVTSYLLMGILCSLLFAFGCEQENFNFKTTEVKDNFEDSTVQIFNTDLSILSHFSHPEINPPQVIEEWEVIEEDTIKCQTQKMEYALGHWEALLFDHLSGMPLGEILKVETIATGGFGTIGGKRDSITFSVSLPFVDGPVKATAMPELASIREALNEILSSNMSGSTPAYTAFQVYRVYSKDHFQTSIGAHGGSWFGDFTANWNSSNSQVRTRFVVKFMQIYYTVDMDLPDYPHEYWTELPDTRDWNYCPVVFSSVKYGRMALFLFESSEEGSKYEFDLEASINTLFASGGVNVDLEQEKMLNEVSVKALIVGGSGETAVQSFSGLEGLTEYIQEGGNFSKDSPAAPLAYTFKFINDKSLAKMVLSSEYNVRSCNVIPKDPFIFHPPNILAGRYEDEIHHIGGDCDTKGKNVSELASVRAIVTGDNKITFRAFFRVRENQPDFTEGIVEKDVTVTVPIPSDKKIYRIVSDSFSEVFGMDDNKLKVKEYELPDGDCARKILVMGDSQGCEVGNCNDNCSWAEFLFNEMVLELVNK